jgi:hypothetical protein
MEKAMAEHGVRLRHVIGKGMGHKFDAESKRAIAETLNDLEVKGRNRTPASITFETYTLKYDRMSAVRIDGLVEHWKSATVFAEWNEEASTGSALLKLQLKNVSALSLLLKGVQLPTTVTTIRKGGKLNRKIYAMITSFETNPSGEPKFTQGSVSVDGLFSDGTLQITAHLDADGQWVNGPAPNGLRKRHNLQGPIDDAFMDSFIFVRPTGTAANEAVGKWAEAELTRAIEHWRRHFRGDARVVNDVDLTDEMIQSSNIVLWGDPKSNSVLAKDRRQAADPMDG